MRAVRFGQFPRNGVRRLHWDISRNEEGVFCLAEPAEHFVLFLSHIEVVDGKLQVLTPRHIVQKLLLIGCDPVLAGANLVFYFVYTLFRRFPGRHGRIGKAQSAQRAFDLLTLFAAAQNKHKCLVERMAHDLDMDGRQFGVLLCKPRKQLGQFRLHREIPDKGLHSARAVIVERRIQAQPGHKRLDLAPELRGLSLFLCNCPLQLDNPQRNIGYGMADLVKGVVSRHRFHRLALQGREHGILFRRIFLQHAQRFGCCRRIFCKYGAGLRRIGFRNERVRLDPLVNLDDAAPLQQLQNFLAVLFQRADLNPLHLHNGHTASLLSTAVGISVSGEKQALHSVYRIAAAGGRLLRKPGRQPLCFGLGLLLDRRGLFLCAAQNPLRFGFGVPADFFLARLRRLQGVLYEPIRLQRAFRPLFFQPLSLPKSHPAP